MNTAQYGPLPVQLRRSGKIQPFFLFSFSQRRVIMAGFPPEALGAAAGVLVYSFFCLFLGGLTIWLVWTHNEKTTYVALITYVIVIATIASIIQQFHTYLDWDNIVAAQFENAQKRPINPQTIIAINSTGVDLALFYIQYCCYNINASLIMFWAFYLCQSIYGWSAKPRTRRILKHINDAGKIMSVILPIITISLLQSKTVQSTIFGFLFCADILLMISLGLGCLLLIAIVAKYIASRGKFRAWARSSSRNVQQGNSGSVPKRSVQGVYDKWLLARFIIGFVVLGGFEFNQIFYQFQVLSILTKSDAVDASELSGANARLVAITFIPGVSACLLTYIVFGTTKPFRQAVYRAFVPKRFQKTLPEPTGESRSGTYASGARSKRNQGRASVHVVGSGPEDIGLGNIGPRIERNTSPISDDGLPLGIYGTSHVSNKPKEYV
ncbi:hypothetical protein F4778DRAFT_283967 [Xylariomycetidae sp. FL2044]|nr:hypothetical protein F4778DRAFT_283967 [Xylariomycetidae sp. FL2044]